MALNTVDASVGSTATDASMSKSLPERPFSLSYSAWSSLLIFFGNRTPSESATVAISLLIAWWSSTSFCASVFTSGPPFSTASCPSFTSAMPSSAAVRRNCWSTICCPRSPGAPSVSRIDVSAGCGGPLDGTVPCWPLGCERLGSICATSAGDSTTAAAPTTAIQLIFFMAKLLALVPGSQLSTALPCLERYPISICSEVATFLFPSVPSKQSTPPMYSGVSPSNVARQRQHRIESARSAADRPPRSHLHNTAWRNPARRLPLDARQELARAA